ncbi:hypothetical protein MKI84_07190 [Ancylobacter sp. A5.8]|uniref:hypothetical protein n=1 Tax=Ancylobacter gelatini TaxID=2919920 RepID=UPI001F4D58ED|nr:hypothetical protein [Ancylobacter gelatini]MCJ8142699.1 hypothetical protein [Ancylobacter gelatini]
MTEIAVFPGNHDGRRPPRPATAHDHGGQTVPTRAAPLRARVPSAIAVAALGRAMLALPALGLPMLVLPTLVLPALVSPAHAADSQQALHFAPGTSSASVSGTVSGSDTALYTLKARAGQTLTVVLASQGSDACVFDVAKPDGSILFNGTDGSSAFTGTLPADAAYQLSVFQMRAAILEGQSCRYTLSVSVN